MKFTEHQEVMLGLYLRESSNTVKDLPPLAQIQSLKQARQRLYEELLNLRCATLEDDDLTSLLERLRVSPSGWQKPSGIWEVHTAASPGLSGARDGQGLLLLHESQASKAERPAQAAGPLESDERRWLGVCIELSERLVTPLLHVRAAFLAAGLLTGPFALLLYLGLYFEIYISDGSPQAQRIAPRKLARAIGGVVALLTVLYAGTAGLVVLGNSLYAGLVSSPLGLGAWARSADYNTPLFLIALLVLAPIATLGALPLPEQARASIQKGLTFGISIYAIMLCLGIASHLTGILLGIANGYSG